ncbi:MAG: hypothetical protein RJA98_1012 [Pseudomonadota bacterium]
MAAARLWSGCLLSGFWVLGFGCLWVVVFAACGSPPGSAPAWRVTFFCGAQKKVTKEEGLNPSCQTSASMGSVDGGQGYSPHRASVNGSLGEWRPCGPLALLRLRCLRRRRPSRCTDRSHRRHPWHAVGVEHAKTQRPAGPPLAQREADGRWLSRASADRHQQNFSTQMRGQMALRALFFGDFLLGPAEESYPPCRGGTRRAATHGNHTQPRAPHRAPPAAHSAAAHSPPRMMRRMQRLQPLPRHVRVDGGGGDVGVSQQHLHGAQIGTVVEQVGGKGVAQGVG